MPRKPIHIVELFSGIGGFSLGLERAGFTIARHDFSEINEHAIACYKYHYKNARHIGSVTDVSGRDLGTPDIITFGSPCQDFSVAGKGEGLKGSRSSLIRQAIRIITQARPRVFIWENVKGSFSSNAGSDFAAILQAFAHIGGYRLEWQLLNTSWLLPQNRERIYLIGHLAGPGGSTPGVFPITKNDRLFNKTRGTGPGQLQPQYRRSHSSCLNANSSKIVATDTFIRQINPSIESNGKQPYQQNRVYDSSGAVPALLSDMSCGAHAVSTLSRKHKNQNGKRIKDRDEPMFTLETTGDHGVMITQRSRGKNGGGAHKTCPTITGNSFEQNNMVGELRRLTEIECERLQGFPDNWTQFGNYDGTIKGIARTNRYNLLGNAVTVDVVKMIGERLEL